MAATYAAASGQPKDNQTPRAANPMIIGTDGSQTGTASFVGNLTTISTSSNALALGREPDCKLTLANGNYTISSGTLNYTETLMDFSYEEVLHEEAQLSTTPDVFKSGCDHQPQLGFGSRPGVLVGLTTSGVYVYAGLGPILPQMVNGIYLMTGTTSLTVTSFQDSTAGNLTAADLDKDGNGDLVITNTSLATSSYVTVMLGKADGTFQNGVSYPTAGNYSLAAVIDDVNGDGKPDIVSVSGDQEISVLLGNGDGTFQTAKSFAAPALPGYTSASQTPIVNLITADLRGIGKKDLVASNGLVLLGKGDGTFAAASSPAFPYAIATSSKGPNLAAGDFNNDGKIDLVFNTGATISTWIGKGDGTFSQGKPYASINTVGFVTVSDLDGDGNADLFVGLGDGGVFAGDEGSANLAYALMGNGDGTFSGAPVTPGTYSGNNLADLNGDGVPDMVSNASGPFGNTVSPSFTVALGTSTGNFSTKSTVTAPDTFVLNGYTFSGVSKAVASGYALGDVNGDGKPDLVFVDNGLTAQNTGASMPGQSPFPVYFVALGNGDGTFQAPTPYAFPQVAPASGFDNQLAVSSLQIADFNKDGHADLIFFYNDQAGGTGVNPYLQGIVVLAGGGNGTFSTTPILTSTYGSATAPTTALVSSITNVADLNGDSTPDLVVVVPSFSIATGATTKIEIFLGNGDGTFKAPTDVKVAGDVYGIPVLTDVNNDHKMDLAFLAETSSSQAELAIALGDGNGGFASATTSNLTGGDAIRSSALAAGDFDGDGNVDLALFENSGFSGIFYGKGDGSFTSVPESGYIVPKDLIGFSAGAPAVAVDLNKGGKLDILAGNTILLNLYGAAQMQLAATPVLSLASGTYTSAQSLTITDSTPGATIYYTTDGSTPSTSSQRYTAAIAINASETVEAIAVAAGYANSPIASATYTIQANTVATPSISPNGGTFTSPQSVTIADATSGSSIYYTTDGSTPTSASTKFTAVIPVNSSETIKAIATATGLTNSTVASATFTINLPAASTPTFSPAAGAYSAAQSVTISDSTTGATLYYTTDGSMPTASSTKYAGAISVGSTETINAIAVATGYANSAVASATYTITLPADFSVGVSPTSVTASVKAPGTATVSVSPLNGFNAPVSFSCSGLPQGASCSFSPATVTPAAGQSNSTALSVSYAGTATALRPGISPLIPGGVFVCVALCFGMRKRRVLATIVLLLGVFSFFNACGGTHRSQPITATTTITATAGTLQHSATLSVTVE